MSLRKLLAALMVVSLVLGLVGTAAFAQGDEALYNEAVQMLKAFKIVEGDAGTGEMRPQDPITRAELMKVLAVASGQAANAELLINAPAPFADVESGVWYTGYITVAKAKGWTTGYPDGTFRPKANVTNAEVIAFLSRVTGLQPAAGAWPTNYITAAVSAGLIPEGVDVAALANAPAIRGAVFVMAHNSFLKVRDAEGKNLYQKTFDSTAPTVTLNKVDATTTAGKITVSGKVEGAVAAFVNGTPLVLGADGSFTAEVELKVGANEIKVTAVDEVGNEGVATASVERQNTPAAAIEAPASVSVAAGGTTTVAFTVKDTNGAAIQGAAVDVKVDAPELGTFDAATGTFTAGTKAGTGTLTLTSGDATATVAVTVTPAAAASIEVSSEPKSAAIGEMVTLKATVKDQYGNVIADAKPTFSLSGDGAFLNGDKMTATKAGIYTVTATVGELTGTGTVGVFSDSVAALKISGDTTVIANDESVAKITVTAVDDLGNVVRSFDGEISLSDDANGSLAIDEAVKDAEEGVATFEISTVDGYQVVGAIFNLTASSADAEVEDAEATLEVLEQVATGVKIDAPKYIAANTANSGDEQTISAWVVDQAGERMLAGTWSLEFSVPSSAPGRLDDGTKLKQSAAYDAPDTDAEAQLWPVKGKTGEITVTVSAEGVGSATATVTAAIAQAPAKITASFASDDNKLVAMLDPAGGTPEAKNFVTVNIQVTDANGVPVKLDRTIAGGDALKVKYDLSTSKADEVFTDNGTGYASGKEHSVELTDGKGSFTIAAETFTGDLAFTISDPEKDLASTSLTASVVAGDAAYAKMTRTTVTVPVKDRKATLTAQLYDEAGNKAPKSGVALTFTPDDGLTVNGKKTAVNVKTNGEGAASVEVVASADLVNAATPAAVTLADKDDVLEGDDDLDGDGDNDGVLDGEESTEVAVAYAVATNMSVRFVADATAATPVRKTTVYATDRLYGYAGASGGWSGAAQVDLLVTLTDEYGSPVTGVDPADLSVEIVEGDINVDLDEDDVVDSGMDWDADGNIELEEDLGHPGRYVATIYPSEAPKLTLKITNSATPTELTSTATLSVQPGMPEAVTVNDDDAISVTADAESSPVVVKLTDHYGNQVTTTRDVEVTVVDIVTADDPDATDEYLIVRSASGGVSILPGDTFTVKAGKNSANLYFLTNYGGTVELQINGGPTYTLDVNVED